PLCLLSICQATRRRVCARWFLGDKVTLSLTYIFIYHYVWYTYVCVLEIIKARLKIRFTRKHRGFPRCFAALPGDSTGVWRAVVLRLINRNYRRHRGRLNQWFATECERTGSRSHRHRARSHRAAWRLRNLPISCFTSWPHPACFGYYQSWNDWKLFPFLGHYRHVGRYRHHYYTQAATPRSRVRFEFLRRGKLYPVESRKYVFGDSEILRCNQLWCLYHMCAIAGRSDYMAKIQEAEFGTRAVGCGDYGGIVGLGF